MSATIKARVLLADDHAIVRSGLSNALRDLPGLEIIGEVSDGQAVLVALDRLRPDLLLIDVAMPHFDPIATTRYIRAHYPHMRILVVSAYDDDVYVQGLLGAGVDGYHLKDQPLGDLRQAVQRVLAGGRWLSDPLVDKLAHRSSPSGIPSLTNRQRDLLLLLHEGLDNQAIARQTGLSVKTVENHLTRLYRQIGVQSRLEAARFAMQHVHDLQPHSPAPIHMPVTPLERDGAIRLLLVDDNARFRQQLSRTIVHVYPQVAIMEAENIRAAVRTVRAQPPNLALVDVVLGDESGIACTQQLKQIAPSLRIVLISAYPDREFHRQGLEAGAVAFLDKKDLDAAALRLLIDDVIG